ncbi:MAG: hypothetical protein EOO25_05480 [Comamonadaceae bacterium]|nr:MAG: hypothetical protein EOO25_05480 [Comamonadaceae bacterium]
MAKFLSLLASVLILAACAAPGPGGGAGYVVMPALTERDFQRIVPGQWTGADVQREFGRPAGVDRVASWNGPVLTYRWRDRQGADMFYWIYLDPQGVVQRAHPGMELRDRRFDFRF